jgi:hypothetical protein
MMSMAMIWSTAIQNREELMSGMAKIGFQKPDSTNFQQTPSMRFL